MTTSYVKRVLGTGYTQTGADSEAVEFVKQANTYTGADTNIAVSVALSSTERVKWVSGLWKPNTLDWTGGTFTWRWRVTTLNSTLSITEVIVRRVSANCQTVVASKSSGAISISLATTGVKSGTIVWNDGTQNPGGRSANDRFEVVFRVNNSSTMSAAAGNVGMNLSSTNDEISCPFDETAETATTPTTQVKVVQFQKPATTTGVQTVTLGTSGFKVKAVYLVATQSTNNTGTYAEGAGISIGFMDGSRNGRSNSTWHDDNVATSNTAASRRNAAICFTSTAALLAEAKADDLETDQFKINWITNNATQYYITAICISGSDITEASVTQHAMPTVNGNLAHTGVGFAADFLAGIPIGLTSMDALSSHSRFGMGFAKSTTQRGAIGTITTDNVAGNTGAFRWQRTARMLINLASAGTANTEADLVSLDTDGFTINYVDAPGSADLFQILAIKGGTFEIGSFNVSAGTGSQTVNLANSTLLPSGIILAAYGTTTQTAIQDHNRLSVGFADSATSEACIFYGDKDAANPTQPVQMSHNAAVLNIATEAATATSSTTEIKLETTSFNNGNFILNKATNTGTLGTIEVLYVAIGVIAAGQNITRALATETVAISETTAGARLAGKIRTKSETLSITETAAGTRLAAKLRALTTETVALAEQIARVRGRPRAPATETITISETSLTRLANKIRTNPETVALSEAVTRLKARIITALAESVTVNAGTAATQKGKLRALATETITVAAGTLARLVAKIRTRSETTTVSETSLTRLVAKIRSKSETITTSDSVSRLAGKIRALATQTVALTDQVAREVTTAGGAAITRTITEAAIVISEARNRMAAKWRRIG